MTLTQILIQIRWRAHYLWSRAQGATVKEAVERDWNPRHIPAWRRLYTPVRLVALVLTMAWRWLPGLWLRAKHGRFMYTQWRQWLDFEHQPLASWPQVKQKVLHNIQTGVVSRQGRKRASSV